MRNKYKFFFCFAILLFVLFPILNLFGQMGGDDFVDTNFVQNIVKTTKEFVDEKFELIIVNTTKPDTKKDFFNASAVFKLQTDIKINNKNFLGSGKYFSVLWIDEDGVFDLGEVFYSDKNKAYNPKITKSSDTYKTFYGTKTGKHYLIAILSNEIPYFGNMYNNKGGLNPIAKKRYIENIKNELKSKKASIFIKEFDINLSELGN